MILEIWFWKKCMTKGRCMKNKELKTERIYLRSGYEITIQMLGDGDKVSHFQITDSRIYPDEDERSEERWRRDGLLIPINSKKKVKEIIKALKNE